MSDFLIISHSASNPSHSRTAAPVILRFLQDAKRTAEIVDIRDLPPAWINATGLEGMPPEYAELNKKIERAYGIIFLGPVYCYSASSIMKFTSEIFNKALTKKPVAFVVSAGTLRSHLALGDLAMSMVFEQETFCFPRQVMLTYDDFDDDFNLSVDITKRLQDLTTDFVLFTEAINYFKYNEDQLRKDISTADTVWVEKAHSKKATPVINDAYLNHLNILALDVDKSLQFYEDVFGVKYLRNLGPRKVVTDFNGFEFYIEEAKDVEANDKVHFGVRTSKEGVLAFSKHIEELQIPYETGNNPLPYPNAAPDDKRLSVYIKDPAGLLIEIYSPERDQLIFENSQAGQHIGKKA